MIDYSIDSKVEPYLHETLESILFSYSSDKNTSRLLDSYRGSLVTSFHLGLISVHSFIFLLNFLRWLECSSDFNETDDDMYCFFHDSILGDF